MKLLLKRLTKINMKITIKDVAKKAGVSVATVSLVVHNNNRISEITKKKVQQAIKDLNYHPSRSARGLVTNKTGNIGFILRDSHFLKTEPFYTRIFLGAEFQARDEDYYLLLATISEDYREENILPRFVLEKNIDGIILAGKVPQLLIDKLAEYRYPIVFVDYIPPEGNYSAVMIDNLRGGLLAAKHLIDYGHKKIAFIGADLAHPSLYDRLQGYKQALYNNGIPFDEDLVIIEDIPGRTQGYRAAKKLLERNKDFTAVFACNDAMAIGIMQFLKDEGYSIPDDISLIGFDDVEADLLIEPSLSTIRVPKIKLGVEALILLKDMIVNRNRNQKKVLVPVELVVRRSTKNLGNE